MSCFDDFDFCGHYDDCVVSVRPPPLPPVTDALNRTFGAITHRSPNVLLLLATRMLYQLLDVPRIIARRARDRRCLLLSRVPSRGGGWLTDRWWRRISVIFIIGFQISTWLSAPATTTMSSRCGSPHVEQWISVLSYPVQVLSGFMLIDWGFASHLQWRSQGGHRCMSPVVDDKNWQITVKPKQWSLFSV